VLRVELESAKAQLRKCQTPEVIGERLGNLFP
jgi:hypothetical protein